MSKARIQTLQPAVRMATASAAGAAKPLASLTPERLRGRAAQARRLRLWSANPWCAHCGKFTAFPDGFELDHRQPLHQGGADLDSNLQVLCSGPDRCHARKTAAEAAAPGRGAVGPLKSRLHGKPAAPASRENSPLLNEESNHGRS